MTNREPVYLTSRTGFVFNKWVLPGMTVFAFLMGITHAIINTPDRLSDWMVIAGTALLFLGGVCYYSKFRELGYCGDDVYIGNLVVKVKEVDKCLEFPGNGRWLCIKARGKWYFTVLSWWKPEEIEILKRKINGNQEFIIR